MKFLVALALALGVCYAADPCRKELVFVCVCVRACGACMCVCHACVCMYVCTVCVCVCVCTRCTAYFIYFQPPSAPRPPLSQPPQIPLLDLSLQANTPWSHAPTANRFVSETISRDLKKMQIRRFVELGQGKTATEVRVRCQLDGKWFAECMGATVTDQLVQSLCPSGKVQTALHVKLMIYLGYFHFWIKFSNFINLNFQGSNKQQLLDVVNFADDTGCKFERASVHNLIKQNSSVHKVSVHSAHSVQGFRWWKVGSLWHHECSSNVRR